MENSPVFFLLSFFLSFLFRLYFSSIFHSFPLFLFSLLFFSFLFFSSLFSFFSSLHYSFLFFPHFSCDESLLHSSFTIPSANQVINYQPIRQGFTLFLSSLFFLISFLFFFFYLSLSFLLSFFFFFFLFIRRPKIADVASQSLSSMPYYNFFRRRLCLCLSCPRVGALVSHSCVSYSSLAIQFFLVICALFHASLYDVIPSFFPNLITTVMP